MKRIIIDTCCAHKVFKTNKKDLVTIQNALLYGKKYQLQLVVGGKLRDEYTKVGYLKSILMELDRAGRVRIESDSQVAEEARELETLQIHLSNDLHVIALASISNARLLFTADDNLQKDFKNKELLDPPRKIYKGERHNQLLR